MFKIILFALILWFNSAYANDLIDQIIKENPRISLAIQVKDLRTGKEVYSYNPDKLMLPASVTKSFTTYAALAFLKEDFIYKTEIIENGNDLYFKFAGDPTMTSHQLEELVKKIPKNKSWNIYIDDFIFDLAYSADGSSIDDSKFCFAAPVSAIVINKNCFMASIEPAKNIGLKAKLESSEKIFAHIDNQIITKNDASCAPQLTAKQDNSYSLTGCLDINSKKIPLNIAYQDPRLMIKSMIKDLLNKHHVKYTKNIHFKAFENKYKALITHDSEALAEIVKNMHKDSDNIAANNIAKTIGAYYYQTQGTFANSSKAIAEILTPKTDINFSEIRIFDGSGESRYNLVAPDQFVNLFCSAYNNKEIWQNFYKSLSIIAVDGTLKSRISDNPEFHGKINAKTGSLKGVSNIVGFIDEKLVFAIMFNGSIYPKSEIVKLEDQILLSIAQEYLP